MKNRFLTFNYEYFSLLLLGSLCLLVAFSPRLPIADESIYFSNLEWKGSPWTIAFIKNYHGTAGIVSSWFYFLLPSSLRVNILYLRWVNVSLFVLSVYLLFKFLLKRTNPFEIFSVVFIPGTFALFGRAMGDFPPILTCVLFLVGLEYLTHIESVWRRLLFLVLIALLGALTIVGKQNLLLVVFTWPILALLQRRITLLELLLLFVLIVPFPLFVFTVWKGLAPANSKVLKLGTLNWSSFEYVLQWFIVSYFLLVGEVRKMIVSIERQWLLVLLLFLILYLLQGTLIADLQFDSRIEFIYFIYHLFLAFTSAYAIFFIYTNLRERSSIKSLAVLGIICMMAFASLNLISVQMRYPAAFFGLLLIFIDDKKLDQATPNYWKWFGLLFNIVNLYLIYRSN